MTWSGRKVMKARAFWRPRLPLPCYRCGRPVRPDHRWTVEHIRRRGEGGAEGVENQWVSHASCNFRDGGRAGGARGAAITNARRTTTSTRRLEDRPLAW